MSEFYDEMIAVAQELIEEFGRPVTLQKLGKATTGSPTPWTGPGSPTVIESLPVAACFVPPSGLDLGKLGITDDMLKRVSQVALVSPIQENLERMDTLLDNVVYKVEWVQVLKPADQTVLYAFGVKR